MEKHRKHANLTRRKTGFFGSNEIALLGTKCSTIKTLVEGISSSLGSGSKIAYVDASHDNTLEKPVVDVFTFHHSGNLDMKQAYDQNSYWNGDRDVTNDDIMFALQRSIYEPLSRLDATAVDSLFMFN